MADAFTQEKPCTVNTERGFSVLYKNRLLYSKYNPEKSILQTIQSLEILPGTLFLCFSPALWYGLKELLQKLPEHCFVIACEADKALYDFELENLEKIERSSEKKEVIQNNKNFLFLKTEQFLQLPHYIENPLTQKDELNLPASGLIKRIVRIDLSAGVQFAVPLYEKIYTQCQNVVSQFWKNRLTLVRFGRLYSRNLFQNLARSQRKNCITFETLQNTIDKPILVCGTGESLEKSIEDLIKNDTRDKVYILAADASLPVLKSYHIAPDGVVGVESQLAIEKNYIGTLRSSFTFFADATSRPHITDLVKGNVCYFTSEYDRNDFLQNLKLSGILPKPIPPLGSVGLTATQIAILLRKTEDIPIFITGLDFSYKAGKTHAKGSASQNAFYAKVSRISKENYDASFTQRSVYIDSKNQTKIITTTVLAGYAKNFTLCFSTVPNLFDIGSTGIPLGIAQEKNWIKEISSKKIKDKPKTNRIDIEANDSERRKKIASFFNSEEKSLTELKNLMQFGDKNLTENELHEKIADLIKNRNYLYLHFPDGYDFSMELSFLKRVRSEIDFFLKDIKTAQTFI